MTQTCPPLALTAVRLLVQDYVSLLQCLQDERSRSRVLPEIRMLQNAFRRTSPSLLLRLSHQLQAVALYSVQIVVPALGDSISDGTIATVLKKSGDAVSENETIAQVETDKVTIDIKAPSEGTILGIVVQEQDTVVPGQLVATLDDAAAKAKLVGGSPSPQQPAPAAPAAAPQPAASASAPPAPAAGHRVPGIRFPPRMTADGRRVSLLPAAEATAIIQQWKTGAGPHAASAAPSTSSHGAAAGGAAATGAHGTADPFAAWAAAQRFAAEQQQSAGPDVPSKFATSVTRLKAMPKRRELSDRDIELIELGGAAP